MKIIFRKKIDTTLLLENDALKKLPLKVTFNRLVAYRLSQATIKLSVAYRNITQHVNII